MTIIYGKPTKDICEMPYPKRNLYTGLVPISKINNRQSNFQ